MRNQFNRRSFSTHPTSDVQIENPLSRERGTALTWGDLLALADRCAVRYMKAMTCLNVDQVFGMGLWEGVPLRDVIWGTLPFVLMKAVGEAFLARDVALDDVAEFLDQELRR